MPNAMEPLTFSHGPAMKNRFMLAPLTNQQSHADGRLSEEEFRGGVRNARGTMPSYGVDALSDDTLATLYAYMSAHDGVRMPVGRVNRGGELYERVGCYSCHSNQGQGIMHGPRIGPNPIRWGRFVWYVRHPSGQMPPYSAVVLSDQDLSDIYSFLRRRPQPRPVEDIPLLAP